MIDRRTVAHVARLARLELDPGDLDALRRELARILGHMEQLGRVDTDDVEPTFHPFEGVPNVTRPDSVRPCLDREDVLAMAPDAEGPLFRVPGMMSARDGDDR